MPGPDKSHASGRFLFVPRARERSTSPIESAHSTGKNDLDVLDDFAGASLRIPLRKKSFGEFIGTTESHV